MAGPTRVMQPLGGGACCTSRRIILHLRVSTTWFLEVGCCCRFMPGRLSHRLMLGQGTGDLAEGMALEDIYSLHCSTFGVGSAFQLRPSAHEIDRREGILFKLVCANIGK